MKRRPTFLDRATLVRLMEDMREIKKAGLLRDLDDELRHRRACHRCWKNNLNGNEEGSYFDAAELVARFTDQSRRYCILLAADLMAWPDFAAKIIRKKAAQAREKLRKGGNRNGR